MTEQEIHAQWRRHLVKWGVQEIRRRGWREYLAKFAVAKLRKQGKHMTPRAKSAPPRAQLGCKHRKDVTMAHYGKGRQFFESEHSKRRRRRRASRETLPPVKYGEMRDVDLVLCDKLAERGGHRRGLLRVLRREEGE
jgi:hypothetical protein